MGQIVGLPAPQPGLLDRRHDNVRRATKMLGHASCPLAALVVVEPAPPVTHRLVIWLDDLRDLDDIGVLLSLEFTIGGLWFKSFVLLDEQIAVDPVTGCEPC